MKYKYFVLDKLNNITIKTTKSPDTVYKTCGYRKNIDFNILFTWNDIELSNNQLSVSLYGKDVGKKTNVNDSEILKLIMNKTIYGPVVFVFTYDSNILKDIDMSIWEEFKQQYIKSSTKEYYESDYTFDEELDDTEDEEDSDNVYKTTDTINKTCFNNNMDISNELDYEPYYVLSDDE